MTKFLEPDFTKTYYTTVKDGYVYYHHLPRWKKPLFDAVNALQWVLWKLGYSWHNSLTDCCCPDFSCCKDKKNR